MNDNTGYVKDDLPEYTRDLIDSTPLYIVLDKLQHRIQSLEDRIHYLEEVLK